MKQMNRARVFRNRQLLVINSTSPYRLKPQKPKIELNTSIGVQCDTAEKLGFEDCFEYFAGGQEIIRKILKKPIVRLKIPVISSRYIAASKRKIDCLHKSCDFHYSSSPTPRLNDSALGTDDSLNLRKKFCKRYLASRDSSRAAWRTRESPIFSENSPGVKTSNIVKYKRATNL